MSLRKLREGKCMCGNKATKIKMASWCCDRCDKCESRMKTEIGALVGNAFRAKYSEMDFRGSIFRSRPRSTYSYGEQTGY